ncbi:MAG TPA: hypothetical protein DEA08_13150 [Planctomycetes bacterium]|nr:hypothetical protein [Planctomycetota bacterium]
MDKRPLEFQAGDTLSLVGAGGESVYFEVLEQIGAGGAGVVYLCVTDDGQCAVVKGPHFVGEVDENLARELEMLETLRPHVNVVRLLGKQRDPRGHHLLVLERAFPNPFERLNEEQVRPRLSGYAGSTGGRYTAPPPATALELGYELARAIRHLHDHKIAHCDVKPENLLVRLRSSELNLSDKDYFEHLAKGRWHGVLIDMGGARTFQELTYAYLGKGPAPAFTPLFTPPEILPGSWDEQQGRECSRFTPWADVYAFGLTLYQLLTGYVPYEHLGERAPQPGDVRAIAEIKREEREGGLHPIARAAFAGIDWSDCRIEQGTQQELVDELFELILATLHYDPARRPNMRRLLSRFGKLLGVREANGAEREKTGREWRQTRVTLDPFRSRLSAAGQDGSTTVNLKQIRRGGADFWENQGFRPTR